MGKIKHSNPLNINTNIKMLMAIKTSLNNKLMFTITVVECYLGHKYAIGQ